jgi:hypothetical protein
MAQFRGYVVGNRGGASRLGGKSSGLTVKADGWDLGVIVHVSHIDGKDVFRIYKTGGNNRGNNPQLITTLTNCNSCQDI